MITKKELMAQYNLLNRSRKTLLDEDGHLPEEAFDRYVRIMDKMQTIIDHVLDIEEQEKINRGRK